MNILLRLKSSILLYSLFMCLVLSYSLVAQSSNSASFELTQYEFEAGASQQVDLNLTLKSQANLLEIQNPLFGAGFVVESVKIITGSKATDIWLTRDSILFGKNLQQTAWVITRKNSTLIQTAGAIQNGDRVLIRLFFAVPKKKYAMTGDSLTATFPDAAKNYMYVDVSLNSDPGDISKYVSAKPILIKHQGALK